MEPGKNKDGYFDNEAILKQFKRLFILLKYKTIFRNHKIMLFVDNARTHSAKKYDKNMLFKKKGTNCPYEYLEWKDESDEIKRVSFFYDENMKNSKGLFVMCQDLGLIPEDADFKSKAYSLDNLRNKIASHPAFDQRSNLEILAEEYGVLLMFLPKFHCELNPIESVWCFIKNFVRKHTDQTFDCMVRLIEEAKTLFNKSDINGKLWRRFGKQLICTMRGCLMLQS
jgi:hypothetical protein